MDFRSKLSKGLVGFEGLKVSCIIGLLPHERIHLQEVLIDLKVVFDTSPEALADDTLPRIDYTILADMCAKEATHGRYRLVETLAANILNLISQRYAIKWAWIRLKKPGAIENAGAAFVELEREFVGEVV